MQARRKEAKELQIKGYSTMKKEDLLKAIRECNTKGRQTSFGFCPECMKIHQIKALDVKIKKLREEARRRRIVEEDGIYIDSLTGEVLDCVVDPGYSFYR